MSGFGERWGASDGVHMVGICGVGMAGVAYLLTCRGCRVSGCDTHVNALATWLRDAGVSVFEKHSPNHLDGAGARDRLIVTPAVAGSEPELVEAQARGLAVLRRGEVLASLVSQGRGIAVCGAHGKTTTSCFTARLLQVLRAQPDWCIGGATRTLGRVAGVGGGKLLVAEADESDGTLALYHPAVTVLTNIDLDHMEHFSDEAALLACFRQAVVQTTEGVAVCADNARAWQVAQAALVPVLTFGFSELADLRATEVCVAAATVTFEIAYRGRARGRVALGVSGRHNVSNALGAAAAALLLGYAPETVFEALPKACDELPGRRFEPVAEVSGIRCVVDYAHHPAELKAAVEMAHAQRPERLIAVFQPHRYTRTLALGPDFPAAFASADEVILLPVYAASEPPLEGGDICDLYAHFRERSPSQKVLLSRSPGEAWRYLRQVLKAGDLLLIAGAGDVIGLSAVIRADVAAGWPLRKDPEGFDDGLRRIGGARVVPFGALAGWSYFGVGGWARWRVEVEHESALSDTLRLCRAAGVPFRIAGAGANAWFSDLGEPGCVIRWAEGACRGFKVGGVTVEASCGWKGPALLDALEREGLSGLEFLEGVPGTLGGWLAMNAGAHGQEIASRVVWIRCLNADGKITILSPDDLSFSYRRCRGLEGCVALACELRLTRAEAQTIRAARQAVRAKRIPLAGLRTAGSVFRNPAGDTAGRLLDAAGCKGLRIGGAYVTAFHANIVAAEGAATASDVLALVMRMRNRLAHTCGAVLRAEICGLEAEEADEVL